MEKLEGLMKDLDRNFWKNKNVLLTGHTGFKGSWLTVLLSQLGTNVIGASLRPVTSPNLFDLANIESLCSKSYFSDIRNYDDTLKIILDSEADIIIHFAAQALVRESYATPLDTFSTNIMGTANILNAATNSSNVKAVLVVTTDKVYSNQEWIWPYREDDKLGGYDPYSASKAASELVISSYRDSFLRRRGVSVASARAGNVIGGGDWSKDRLIPDAIRHWREGKTLNIRNPGSTRPWQHVLEPLHGYLLLLQKLWKDPSIEGAYNFGPDLSGNSSVNSVIELAKNYFPLSSVAYGTASENLHESNALSLDISKARTVLGYSPRWDLESSVRKTMLWYLGALQGKDSLELCVEDIESFYS